jgi:NAD(P)-dependent dehydrogenase (short-subunit alcohol dehydrogenase family)
MVNILVTGANRGIGYAIVQTIATRRPISNIILACRSKTSAEEAIQTLRDSGVEAGLDNVELDIENDTSIESAVAAIDKKYGSLDGQSRERLIDTQS